MTSRPASLRASLAGVSRSASSSPRAPPAGASPEACPGRFGNPRADAAGRASAMAQHHRLQRREAVQRLETLFASVPGMLDAAERQLDAPACAVVVHEHLPALHRAGHAKLPGAV